MIKYDSKGIKKWRFVTYNWKNQSVDDSKQFGLIAQDTPDIATYNHQDDVWGLNASKQTMFNSRAIQQLAIQHENTLELASAAYIGIEEHQVTLNSHDSRIESLEKELEEANQKIEELERKIA